MVSNSWVSKWTSTQPLVRFDAAAISNVALPPESKEFLTSVGLPIRRLRFAPMTHLHANLPRLLDVTTDEVVPHGSSNLHVFSHHERIGRVTQYNCIAVPSGRVYGLSVHRYGSGPPTMTQVFANSSILQFAQFILLLNEYGDWIHRHIESQPEIDEIDENWFNVLEIVGVRARVKSLLARLRRIDRFACGGVMECQTEAIDSAYAGLTADTYWKPFIHALITRGLVD